MIDWRDGWDDIDANYVPQMRADAYFASLYDEVRLIRSRAPGFDYGSGGGSGDELTELITAQNMRDRARGRT